MPIDSVSAQPLVVYAKHETIKKVIRELTKEASLTAIQEHLANENSWYKAISQQPGLTLGCWLYAYEKTSEYCKEGSFSDNDDIVIILNNIADMYRKGCDAEQKGWKASLVDLPDSLKRLEALLQQLTTWCSADERTSADIGLIKAFLIVGSTLAQRFRSMSFIEKRTFNPAQLESIRDSLKSLNEAAVKSVERLDPNEAVKTLEQHLENDLANKHHKIFDVSSKERMPEKFTIMKNELTARQSDFKELYALRYLQDLFKNNEEKTIGREYFIDLIGGDLIDGNELSADCFDHVLTKASESERNRWRQAVTEAETRSMKTTALYCVSTVLAPVNVMARYLWSSALKQIASTPALEAITSVFETVDSQNKKDFCAWVDDRIDKVCARISLGDAELESSLKTATPEKIKELEVKTKLLIKLYDVDAFLADYIEKNNTMFVKLGRWFSQHYPRFKGPVGLQVLRAETYQSSVKDLKKALMSKGDFDENILKELQIRVNNLENIQIKYKTARQRLAGIVKLSSAADLSEGNLDEPIRKP